MEKDQDLVSVIPFSKALIFNFKLVVQLNNYKALFRRWCGGVEVVWGDWRWCRGIWRWCRGVEVV